MRWWRTAARDQSSRRHQPTPFTARRLLRHGATDRRRRQLPDGMNQQLQLQARAAGERPAAAVGDQQQRAAAGVRHRSSSRAVAVASSRCAVGSSRTSTEGSARKVRARARPWPPDRARPRSPTTVSSPASSDATHSSSLAPAGAARLDVARARAGQEEVLADGGGEDVGVLGAEEHGWWTSSWRWSRRSWGPIVAAPPGAPGTGPGGGPGWSCRPPTAGHDRPGAGGNPGLTPSRHPPPLRPAGHHHPGRGRSRRVGTRRRRPGRVGDLGRPVDRLRDPAAGAQDRGELAGRRRQR